MAQIVRPQKQPEVVKGNEGGGGFGQKLGAAAGAVIGGMTTGGAGAVAGAATGAQLGGMAGNWINPATADQVIQQSSPQPVQTAMDRRMGAIEQDPMFALKQAKAAVAKVDAKTRKAYEPIINEAMQVAHKQGYA